MTSTSAMTDPFMDLSLRQVCVRALIHDCGSRPPAGATTSVARRISTMRTLAPGRSPTRHGPWPASPPAMRTWHARAPP